MERSEAVGGFREVRTCDPARFFRCSASGKLFSLHSQFIHLFSKIKILCLVHLITFAFCDSIFFPRIFQLPAAQLENAMNRLPALKAPIVEHASQPSIRTTLPRFELIVLQHHIVNRSIYVLIQVKK